MFLALTVTSMPELIRLGYLIKNRGLVKLKKKVNNFSYNIYGCATIKSIFFKR